MIHRRLGAGCIAAVLAFVASDGRGAAAKKEPLARNVIILVADGGGFNIFRAAGYYQHGRLGAQVYDQPEWVKFASRTEPYSSSSGSSSYSSSNGDSGMYGEKMKDDKKDSGYDPDKVWDADVERAYAVSLSRGIPFKGYSVLKQGVTDSAAGATAMTSGRKTSNGRINYLPSGSYDESPARKGLTIAEVARSLGKSTGVVTSVQWSDATPACFGAAHAGMRTERHDIANEMLNSGVLDVIMGTGHPEYDRNGAPREPASESDYDVIGGSLTWELLRTGTHARGWKLIETRADFERLMSGTASLPLVGIPRVSGVLQQERQTRDWNRDGVVDDADAKVAPPYGDPLIETVPTLVTMTRAALNLLGRNPKGFFVMIEGGAVDKAGHANQPGRQIEEQIDFNKSIEAVVEWVETHSNWRETLVIITADHETGLLWGVNSDMIAFQPLVNHGVNRPPGMWYQTTAHSNSLVPLKARGTGAKRFESKVIGFDPVYGQYVDNTSIYEVMNSAMKGAASESSGSSNGGYRGAGSANDGYKSTENDGSTGKSMDNFDASGGEGSSPDPFGVPTGKNSSSGGKNDSGKYDSKGE
jgi:alkaline phosphatase